MARSNVKRAKDGAARPPHQLDGQIGTDEALFDYSEAEWHKILAAIQSLYEHPLSVETVVPARGFLVHAAQVFQSEEVHGMTIRRRRTIAKRWRRVASTSDKLRGLLVGLVDDKRSRRELSHLQSLSFVAAAFASKYEGRIDGPPIFTEREIYNPRTMYLFKVLNVWIKCGGRLRFSRHPQSKAITGPLARYFCAVTRPVMGSNAPSLESLREIIGRHEQMMVRWLQHVGASGIQNFRYGDFSGDLLPTIIMQSPILRTTCDRAIPAAGVGRRLETNDTKAEANADAVGGQRT